MLISFSVRNFRTFRDKVEWSLIASPDKTREEDNVIDVPAFGLRLLKSAVVYGANASGKSKLIEALNYMDGFMAGSSKSGQVGEPTRVEPFKLNPDSANAPTEFEMQFILNNELYRYGFEVSAKRVEAEWLYVRGPKQTRIRPEAELFYRAGNDITIDAKKFGGIINEIVKNSAVRENALLLSVAAQFNHPRAVAILDWTDLFTFLSGSTDVTEAAMTFVGLRYPEVKKRILDFLSNADLDIENVQEGKQEQFDFNSAQKSVEPFQQMRKWTSREYMDVKTFHRVYNDSGEPLEPIAFSLLRDESFGTRKLLSITGAIISSIETGGVLVVDELDARLHPNIVSKIVQLFNSKETNPNNAQLLFNTHDTNLLTSGNFRRDQIWFTEKNRYGEATLYSLADFKTDVVRKGDNLEANYVRGKYGAVPYLGDFNALPKPNADAEPKPQASHE